MRELRDYYIRDEFGVVWNDEPFATRRDAGDFRYHMTKTLNSQRTLTVFSMPRPGVVVAPQPKPVVKRVYREDSEF